MPQFEGSTNSQKDAFEAGLKRKGLTIHFVTEDLDGGAIIYQEKVDIGECKSAGGSLRQKCSCGNMRPWKKVVDNLLRKMIR